MGSKEQTAMRHARAFVEKQWPKAPTHEAKRSVITIMRDGKPVQITQRVDLFGVFDIMVLPRDGGTVLIQVTTWNPNHDEHHGAVGSRKSKIRQWIDKEYQPTPHCEGHPEIWLIAWENGKYFRAWYWGTSEKGDGWSKTMHLLSPLIKRSTVPLFESEPAKPKPKEAEDEF